MSKDDERDGEARDDIDVALSRLKRSPSATQLWAESRARDRTVAASEKVYRLWADPAESPRGSAARGGDGLSRLWADPAESPRAAARAEGLSRLWADPASSAADY